MCNGGPPPPLADNGLLSFQELVQQILPPDYQGKDYFQKRDEEIERETVLNSTVMDPIAHCHSMPKSLQNEAPSDDDIVQALQTKIVERTKRPNDQYREGKATTLSCQLLLLVCTAFTYVDPYICAQLHVPPTPPPPWLQRLLSLDRLLVASSARTFATACAGWELWLQMHS